jgi:(2Fe-2S) ferredoxin
VRVEDVPEIVESHLVNGVPVERLRLTTFRTK